MNHEEAVDGHGIGHSSRLSLEDDRVSGAFPSAKYLGDALTDAELLLAYAAESGIATDATLTTNVLAARLAATHDHWTPPIAKNLMAALTILAARLRPITAETLRLCASDSTADQITRRPKRLAILLTLLIVPFSLATFATSAISSALRQDLTTANALAVTLGNELPPPGDKDESNPNESDLPGMRKGLKAALDHGASEKEVIQHLQEIAATTRDAYTRGKQLNFFLAFAEWDPITSNGRKDARTDPAARKEDLTWRDLELPPSLPDLSTAATDRIKVYQQIRYFAQTVDGLVSILYGAFASCVLPVLYALLGTCAYLLRRFEQQLTTKTLAYPDGHGARFVIAGIAGAVIGLFSNLNFGKDASVSPLAIAFLVGYAVDVFFAFLEGLIQSFNRVRSSDRAAIASPSTSADGRANAEGDKE